MDADKEMMFESNKKYFYGGVINCIFGDISVDSIDKILDLIDEYIELVESLQPV